VHPEYTFGTPWHSTQSIKVLSSKQVEGIIEDEKTHPFIAREDFYLDEHGARSAKGGGHTPSARHGSRNVYPSPRVVWTVDGQCEPPGIIGSE